MISDHDSIIKLLNGYLNRSDSHDHANDVFLDRHGQPTDRFLEVLSTLITIILLSLPLLLLTSLLPSLSLLPSSLLPSSLLLPLSLPLSLLLSLLLSLRYW